MSAAALTLADAARMMRDTYLHDDATDLAEAFDGLAPWTVED